MKSRNCPNCGANLNSESLRKGTCLYCGTTLPNEFNSGLSQKESHHNNDNLILEKSRKKRSNRPFVFLWVFACFAIGVNMLKNEAPGLIGFIPFIMGIVGAVEMLRRNPKRSGKRPPYPKNSGDNR